MAQSLLTGSDETVSITGYPLVRFKDGNIGPAISFVGWMAMPHNTPCDDGDKMLTFGGPEYNTIETALNAVGGMDKGDSIAQHNFHPIWCLYRQTAAPEAITHPAWIQIYDHNEILLELDIFRADDQPLAPTDTHKQMTIYGYAGSALQDFLNVSNPVWTHLWRKTNAAGWLQITNPKAILKDGDVILKPGKTGPELIESEAMDEYTSGFVVAEYGYAGQEWSDVPYDDEEYVNGTLWRKIGEGDPQAMAAQGVTSTRRLPGNRHYAQRLPLP